MASFQTKNPNLGKFSGALELKMLEYFIVIWNILQPFGTYILWPSGRFCDNLVYFSPVWYIASRKICQPWLQDMKLHSRNRSSIAHEQGCQMVYFQTKNPNLGKCWRVLQWNTYIGIFYGHLVYFTAI
jgi:hypothetical protein